MDILTPANDPEWCQVTSRVGIGGAVVVVLGLVLAGCDGDGSSGGTQSETTVLPIPSTSAPAATPTPGPTPTSSPTPTAAAVPTPAALSADEAAMLVVDGLAIGFESDQPPGEGVTDDQASQLAAITTEAGSAREFLTDQVLLSSGPDVSFRGEVVGEALGDPVVEGDSGNATICVATVVDNVVDDGPDLGKSDHYTTHEVAYSWTGDAWVMSDIAVPGDGDGTGATCVPPTLEQELTQVWERYVAAQNAHERDTSDAEAAAAYSALLVGEVETEPNTTVQDWDDSVYGDLRIDRASPRDVRMSWCLDMSRDPDAAYVFEDGTSQPGLDQAWVGTWTRVDGQWLQDSFRQAFEEPGESLDGLRAAWRRCFS